MSIKKISGQAIIVSNNIPVALGTGIVEGGLWIHANKANVGTIYIGNDGNNSISSTTGYALEAEDTVILDYVYDLSTMYVVSSSAGDKVEWLLVNNNNSR